MTKEKAKYFPQTKEELKNLIRQRVKEDGNEVDLNDIDVSAITDMSRLFQDLSFDSSNFNGNISAWDVSNVTNMNSMFYRCTRFNGDISKWNVSKVTDMSLMFDSCESFNQDISNWDVSNVTNMNGMFFDCYVFNQNLSKWDVSNVTNM